MRAHFKYTSEFKDKYVSLEILLQACFWIWKKINQFSESTFWILLSLNVKYISLEVYFRYTYAKAGHVLLIFLTIKKSSCFKNSLFHTYIIMSSRWQYWDKFPSSWFIYIIATSTTATSSITYSSINSPTSSGNISSCIMPSSIGSSQRRG